MPFSGVLSARGGMFVIPGLNSQNYHISIAESRIISQICHRDMVVFSIRCVIIYGFYNIWHEAAADPLKIKLRGGIVNFFFFLFPYSSLSYMTEFLHYENNSVT